MWTSTKSTEQAPPEPTVIKDKQCVVKKSLQKRMSWHSLSTQTNFSSHLMNRRSPDTFFLRKKRFSPADKLKLLNPNELEYEVR